MLSSLVYSGLALLPFVHAKTIQVSVGKGGLVFDPPATSADIGDQVIFTFVAKNHTVTQTSFADVCSKKEGGFDSGFQPVPANATSNFPTFTVPVNTKDPLWFYCGQAAGLPASHCGQGMVFAINCPLSGENSLENFKKKALDIGKSLAAGNDGGYGGGYGGGSPAATAAYGGYTVPPEPSVVVVTQPITVGSSSWVTTYSSYPGSPAPTPASLGGTVHKVIVGGPGKLAFDPPQLNALPRDIVQFEFHQKNHSVVQSAFADPCRRLTGGFASGLQPVADGATEFPSFNLTINGTEPIWAYCSQQNPSSHCGAGMVFAINAVDSSPRNFTAFQALAEVMNGTAAAASVPQPTGSPQPTNSASMASLPFSSLVTVLATVFTVALTL